MKKSKSPWEIIKIILFVFIGILAFAYGFQITDVDLSELRDESRIVSRIRVARSLASPDIFDLKYEESVVFAPIQVPCPKEKIELSEQDTSGPYLVFSPPCANPESTIQIEGFNFLPNAGGPVSFIPSSDKNHNIGLRSTDVRTNNEGYFITDFDIPPRPDEEDYQLIRAKLRQNVGITGFSENAILTGEKIIETIFLALLATTIGTVLAIPISFLAARNIMADVKKSLTSISLSIIGWPVGIIIGFRGADILKDVTTIIENDLPYLLLILMIIPILIRFLFNYAIRRKEQKRNIINNLVQGMAQISIIIIVNLGLLIIANLGLSLGSFLEGTSGITAFFGIFVYQVSDILNTIISLLIALIGGAMISGVLGKAGDKVSELLSDLQVRFINIIVTPITLASIFAAIGYVIEWLYQIKNPTATLWIPSAVGGFIGLVLAIIVNAKIQIPIGIGIYYLVRTILNVTRSIEPLVMVIVAVIWVGIGPFAGVLALALHTIAALAKLYSEQVESILPGPVEAVQATGANKLQTIIYAVVPQIIPPFISFTMYRWDINVRMSTIIGFAGGGGIGSLLFQNLQLGDYSAVSAQMLSIAVVVATMDYLSSKFRERFV